MRRFLLLILCCSGFTVFAQHPNVHPTITPTLFQSSTTITVTYNVTGTPLASLTDAWAWVWIPDAAAIDAKYNHNPPTAADSPAKFTKSTVGGQTTFTLTFKPQDFFVQDISTKTSMGILLKASDWSGGQTVDHIANFGFSLTLNQPSARPVFVAANQNLAIQATAPASSTFELFLNGNATPIDTQTGITSYTYSHNVGVASGSLRLKATSVSGNAEVTFQYLISSNSPVQSRPAGIISGINYKAGDNTKVTLCVLAPGKTSAYVRGDFSNWDVLPENLMKRDGEYFWIELSGLTSGTEYAFQYLIDESIWIADPYSDKILDPDDQYILETTYPSLKDFPTKALGSQWYWNRLSVFQTNQTPYNWQVTNFDKPDKDKLVVYELLIRDFFEDGENNYQSLIDTMSYFKRLGINAIELMPIMEFGGNNSWGYNPQFMFAPDKAYGTRNKLKEFIDVCHQNGIAVILDIAMNHQDMPNPHLLLDFNYTTSKPNPTNKFFNVEATHPFNVFFDMNHESAYTKKYLDTINYYWLHEYKIDGYRFDLSKGFTQVNNPNNVNAWSAYDPSRIALLKRMSDKIWANFPDAYVILEHLSVNAEEKELAEYRSGEGKGMMLWGNLNHAYLQSAMGYVSESDFSGVYYASVNRNWTVPHLISYMESHDEERMIYKNVAFGNAAGTYSVKDLNTALSRAQAAATIFYTIPGPKMLWQFGELGYDYSINYCEDGTISDACRTYPKPVKWDYLQNSKRKALKSHVADLLRLRNEYDVFTSGSVTLSVSAATLEKQLMLKNIPYTETPANADEMNAVVVVNFDVTAKTTSVNFPHTGTWYDYYLQGVEVNIASATTGIQLKPGEYKIFTDVQIEGPEIITGSQPEILAVASVYPNPAGLTLMIASEEPVVSLSLTTMQGVTISPRRVSTDSWDISDVAAGLYIANIKTLSGSMKVKVIKQNN